MKRILLVLLCIVAISLRLYKLGVIPNSMSDDEIRETMESYSIAKTGHNLNGKFLPLVFTRDGFSYAPVPIYLTSVVLSFSPLSMTTARLPYALCGIMTVLVLFQLIYALFKDKPYRFAIAWMSAFSLAISPWHIHISRFAHEGIFPLLFYLLGILFIVQTKRKDIKKPILSGICFLLGFYSYAATKLVYIPLIGITWYFFRSSFTKRSFITYIGIALLTIISFSYLSYYQQAASYAGGRIFIEDIQTANIEVANQRVGSQKPELIKKLLHNKVTYWGREFLKKYLYTFSGQYLFTDGEAAGIYSLPNRGQLYLFELPLIVLGVLYLFAKHRKIFWFILCLMLISPLPSGLGVSRPTYTHQSVFLIPWLSLLSSGGVIFLLEQYKKTFPKYVLGIALVTLSAYALGSYLQQYYFEWSHYGGSYFSQTTQTMVRDLIANKGKNIIVYADSSNLLLHYAFYTSSNPILYQRQLHVTLDAIQFYPTCTNTTLPKINSYLIYVKTPCSLFLKPTRSIQEQSGEVVWNIYEK